MYVNIFRWGLPPSESSLRDTDRLPVRRLSGTKKRFLDFEKCIYVFHKTFAKPQKEIEFRR